jgi:hypothetical protein
MSAPENKTKDPSVIIVTGSRDWKNVDVIKTFITLAEQVTSEPRTLIHGGARGADTLTSIIVKERGWKVVCMPAKFIELGRRAGPMRNQEMINTGQPHVALVFRKSGSSGTSDCLKRLYTEQQRPESRLNHIFIAEEK